MLANDEYPNPEEDTDLTVIRNRLIKIEFGNTIELVDNPRLMPPVLRAGARGKEITVREIAQVRIISGMELPDTTKFFDARNVLATPPGGGLVDSNDRPLSLL